ncbi:hypothetical protein [Streptomyces sp. NPDC014006]|uniref:hypothetical protein n=1 Tax=Streptomyces sp. NPDC014006 TaxID=3364870 RepID=UPI0036FB7528
MLRGGRRLRGALLPLAGQPPDAFRQLLHRAGGGGRPPGLVAALLLRRFAVGQFHQPGDLRDRAVRGGGADHLVGVPGAVRRPGERRDQPADVLHGPFDPDGAQHVGRRARVLPGLLEEGDQLDDVLQRPLRGSARQSTRAHV